MAYTMLIQWNFQQGISEKIFRTLLNVYLLVTYLLLTGHIDFIYWSHQHYLSFTYWSHILYILVTHPLLTGHIAFANPLFPGHISFIYWPHRISIIYATPSTNVSVLLYQPV